MPDQKQDRAMVDEAKKILSDIVTHQKNNTDRLSQFDKQVDELKRAQRLLEESVYRGGNETTLNDDSELKSFIRKDGSIQWTTEKGYVDTKNGRQQVENKGLLDAETPANEWHSKLIEINTQRNMARLLMREGFTPKLDAKLQKHINQAPRNIKAAIEKAAYDAAGVGGDWVPDQFSAQLYEAYTTPRTVRSLFAETPMDRNVLLVPRLDRGGRPYLKGQVTSDNPANYTASTIATSQKQISAQGLATRYVIDDALAEDSAIALIPTLQRQIAEDLASAVEDAIINGDTAATHQDDIANWNIRERWGSSGLGGSADHRRAWIGLRAAAFDRSSTEDASSFDFAKILTILSKLGELSSSDKVIIASPECIVANFLGLTQVLTLDKFGPAATILPGGGQIANIAGMPIVMSRFMGDDLNASGLYDNVTKTKTGMLLVARDSWQMFGRRGVVVEQDKDITAGAINLVATERVTFNTLDADSTKNVAYGFNMSK
jgi:HK97 family phage major capsid protein